MKNVKLTSCYEQGMFRDLKYYLELNNKIPHQIIQQLEAPLDLESVDLDELQKHFPNATISFCKIKDERKTSAVDETDDTQVKQDYVISKGDYYQASLGIYNGQVFYIIDEKSVQVLFSEGVGEVYLDEIFKLINRKSIKPEQCKVKLIAYNGDYYTIDSKIVPTTVNIDEYYNDDFKPVYEDIIKFLNEPKSGLIVARGAVGSGKTTLIRHLITNYPKQYIIVTPGMIGHIAAPEFISFMLDHKNSVLILEDCEQMLVERQENVFGNAITNLLNMTDGILSDILNIKCICTFNADIDNIDPAVLRKGRCFANYEFRPLDANKTKVLLERQGIHLEHYKPMTLAEIFNYNTNDYNQNHSTKKIGFNVK